MGLREFESVLPPGFRFYPSDEELVCHYLYKKIANEEALKGTLVEIDLHTCEPWQLPDAAKLNANEWYFFSFRDRKYATGYRTNRATKSGYWKATGKDRIVMNPTTGSIVGMRKTLVFYRNRAPHGIKTGWIMHEFRLESPHLPPKEDWVLCRAFHKSKGSTESGDIDTTISSFSLSDQTAPCGYQQEQITLTSSNSLHQNQNSLLSFAQFSQETNAKYENDPINSKVDIEEYGFLWDMNFEQNSLENEVPMETDNNTMLLI